MFGFHPFATQAFSSAIPFLDVQTTTNLVSAAMSSATTVAQAEPNGSNLILAAAISSPAIVSFALPSGNELAAAINNVAPFTWGNVSDISDQTWSAVSDTGNQTWTQVDDTTDQEWSDL